MEMGVVVLDSLELELQHQIRLSAAVEPSLVPRISPQGQEADAGTGAIPIVLSGVARSTALDKANRADS